jgi:II/X family phage/plasmid replication protein
MKRAGRFKAPAMIDWITARVSVRAASQLETGRIISFDADGVVNFSIPRRISTRGSHDSTVSMRRIGDSQHIEIAGSPAKFLQGHNLFGSDDLQGIGAAMIERVCGSLGLELLDEELFAVREGRYELLRVDINYSFATGSRANVLAWIDSAAAVGSLQHRGRGRLHNSSTVSWGEGSRYWKLKAYSKGDEIETRGRKLPETLPMRAQLAEWGDDKLRIELELHVRQLRKLGFQRASSWRKETPWQLFRGYLARLRLGGHVVLTPAALQSIPLSLRQTYSNWVHGADLVSLMSRAKYFRHRSQLLEHGINIGVPPQPGQVPTIPLSQYLQMPCAEVPAWVMGTEVYYESGYEKEGLVGGERSIRVRRESGVTRPQQVPHDTRVI